MVTRCGNTGGIVCDELCGLCRVHGCEGHKSYEQIGGIMVTINDVNLDEELLCEIRIPRGIDREKITNPFRILGFDVRMIGGLSNGDNIYEVTSKVR